VHDPCLKYGILYSLQKHYSLRSCPARMLGGQHHPTPPRSPHNTHGQQCTLDAHYIIITTHTHIKNFTNAINIILREPLYKDTPEMRTSPLIRTPSMVPGTLKSVQTTPEMRTPPLIRTLSFKLSQGCPE
jgi:hypothetical protein